MIKVSRQREFNVEMGWGTGGRQTKEPIISDGLLVPAFAETNLILGNVLLSHTVTHAVPSALKGLTSVFGMGTGVTPPPWPPKPVVKRAQPRRRRSSLKNSIASTNSIVDPSPRPISTGRLNTLLCVHLRPINVVVYHGPYLVIQ